MREYHREAVKETSRLLFFVFPGFFMATGRGTGESDRTGRQESGDEGDGQGDGRVGTRKTGEDDRRGGEGDGTGGQDGVFQDFTIRAAAKSGGVGALRFRASYLCYDDGTNADNTDVLLSSEFRKYGRSYDALNRCVFISRLPISRYVFHIPFPCGSHWCFTV